MAVKRTTAVLAAAAALAVAMPAVLLGWPVTAPAPVAQPDAAVLPVTVPPPAPVGNAYRRPLFAATPASTDAAPEDAPELTGVAGRLGRDAVAFVRQADGGTRTLAVGDSVDGWQLESLSADAAFFRRGTQQARVPLPGDE